jgi:hydroxypyruvate isomerase
VPIANEFKVPLTDVAIVFTLTLWMRLVGATAAGWMADRGEPDRGEVNFPHLFNLVDSLHYDGWIGCEYRPKARTEEGLGWLPKPFYA